MRQPGQLNILYSRYQELRESIRATKGQCLLHLPRVPHLHQKVGSTGTTPQTCAGCFRLEGPRRHARTELATTLQPRFPESLEAVGES